MIYFNFNLPEYTNGMVTGRIARDFIKGALWSRLKAFSVENK